MLPAGRGHAGHRVYAAGRRAAVAPVPSMTLGPPPAVAQAPVVQANHSENAARVDELLQQLSNPQERVRQDATLDLGRLKASKAVEPLMRLLATDNSPTVRDAAACGAGLIASPQSLKAAIQAARVPMRTATCAIARSSQLKSSA